MSAIPGTDVTLRLGDGGIPTETFTTIGGVQVTSLEVAQAQPNARSVLSNGWRKTPAGMGERTIKLTARGYVTYSATEIALRNLAISLTPRNVELAFSGHETWRGLFTVTSYALEATRDEPVTCRFTLESAGVVAVI